MNTVQDNKSNNKNKSLVFTDSAANKVAELIAEENNPELKLRISIQGGGCSGFQYDFSFDEAVNDDDFVFKKNNAQLLIDAMSYQYLSGAEIDYRDDLDGARFIVRNPNAKTTCGCGSSFAVNEQAESVNDEENEEDEDEK